MLVIDLLSSVIDNNDVATLFQVKDEFLLPKERTYLVFVKDFYQKHAKLPDIDTVQNKFNILLPENQEPAAYWKDEIINKFKESVIERGITEAAKNKGKAIEIFQQAIIEHNVDLDTTIVAQDNGQRKKDRYAQVKQNKGIAHISTGSAELDAFSLGYNRADLWSIGGAEGSGKTWQLCRMANDLDYDLLSKGIDRNILFVSGEMDADEIEGRNDCIRCGLPYGAFSKGQLTPIQERRYTTYADTDKSNIKIIDSFDGLKDVEYFITVLNPIAVFLDGSHLLASSYEWTDIARVTSTMKKITRNKKVPFINTTHLKADKGKSGKGGSIDDFAYTKGYTRDSDIAGVLFKDEHMELENKFGIHWVKVRRGNQTRMIWEQDFDKCTVKLTESLSGQLLAAAKVNNMGPVGLPPADDGKSGGLF